MPFAPRPAERSARARRLCVGAGSVVLLVAATPCLRAGAQTAATRAPVRLDEGSFTVSINGQRAGREQFSIQQVMAADGATLEVRAESAISDRRSAVRLDADSAGTPVRYSVEERRGADLTLRLGGQRVRGRFATLARSLTGEAAREYLLRPGAVVVEDDGIVQHALLMRGIDPLASTGVTLPSLTPIANTQGVVRIVPEADEDAVAIAGVRVAARRWRCVTNEGEVRLIWTDQEGHLLRLRIPARNLDALRDDVPR